MIEQIVGCAEQEREVRRSAKTYQDLQMAFCQLFAGTAQSKEALHQLRKYPDLAASWSER